MKNHAAWMALCEQASKEQDPKKLSALVAEILSLMDDKQARLAGDGIDGKSHHLEADGNPKLAPQAQAKHPR